MSFAFPAPEIAFAEVLKGGDGQGQTFISLGHISRADLSGGKLAGANDIRAAQGTALWQSFNRSEEHTSELQSLMRISYAVFCLKKKKNHTNIAETYASMTADHKIH